MKEIITIIKILMELLPLLPYIIKFLEGLREIKRQSGEDVANQIAQDSAVIAENWKSYLNQTRNHNPTT